jgi:hypothetical protein
MSVNVKVTSPNSTTVRIGQTNATRTLTSARVGNLRDLLDVDLSAVTDGSVLVYDSATKKFTATNELTDGSEVNLTIDGGEF